MKKLIILLLLTLAFNLSASVRSNTIQLHKKGAVGTHFDLPVPAIEPDVYYDSDAQQIIVEGTGNVSYYDV